MIIFLAELLTENGVNVLIAATAPRRAYRDEARKRLKRFAEVYVDCPKDECRKRDLKGLWKQADRGEITALPGAGVPYEPPDSPEVKVNTAELSIEEAAHHSLNELETQRLFQL
jgi:adenylylsulfate kinase-like enzyme